MYNQLEVIEYLLQQGADVNCVNKQGNTPLHRAVSQKYIEGMKLLLEYGADPCIPNNESKLPKHVTTKLELIALLESYEVPIRK